LAGLLSEWPVDHPRNWLEVVNRPQTPAEEKLLKTSIDRSRPFGTDVWMNQTAGRLKLQQSLRPRGRPPGWRKVKRDEK
jgi:putative transposase